jgi:hypothetical protein
MIYKAFMQSLHLKHDYIPEVHHANTINCGDSWLYNVDNFLIYVKFLHA